MKRLVVDVDGTLTLDDQRLAYSDRQPRIEVVEQLRRYREDGFSIIIATSRNMRTFKGSIGHINANTMPILIEWLDRHDIPYDEIHVGKPWCGTEGFYVDDKAVRPSEFCNLSYGEILRLLAADSDESERQQD